MLQWRLFIIKIKNIVNFIDVKNKTKKEEKKQLFIKHFGQEKIFILFINLINIIKEYLLELIHVNDDGDLEDYFQLMYMHFQVKPFIIMAAVVILINFYNKYTLFIIFIAMIKVQLI